MLLKLVVSITCYGFDTLKYFAFVKRAIKALLSELELRLGGTEEVLTEYILQYCQDLCGNSEERRNQNCIKSFHVLYFKDYTILKIRIKPNFCFKIFIIIVK